MTQTTAPIASKLQDSVGSTRMLALDGWRAIACLLVVFTHTGFFWGWYPIYVWGFSGVHLFFVLSGYLLFTPFCRSIINQVPLPAFGPFYLRRLLRIYPPYLLALVAFSALRYVTNRNPPTAFSFVTHALLVFNWFDPAEFFKINSIYWTLAIEAQFYVLLPLITWLFSRGFRNFPRRAVVGIVAVFFGVGLLARALEFLSSQTLAHGMPSVVRFRTVFSYLDLFACGMMVAAIEGLLRERRACQKVSERIVLATGLVVFLAANYWCTQTGAGDWMMVNDFWFSLLFAPVMCIGLAAILFAVVGSGTCLPRLLAARPLVFTGQISYSVYLLHVMVQLPMFKLLPLNGISSYRLRTFCWGLISLGPTLALAFIVFRFVEFPCMKAAARYRGESDSQRGKENDSSKPVGH